MSEVLRELLSEFFSICHLVEKWSLIKMVYKLNLTSIATLSKDLHKEMESNLRVSLYDTGWKFRVTIFEFKIFGRTKVKCKKNPDFI